MVVCVLVGTKKGARFVTQKRHQIPDPTYRVGVHDLTAAQGKEKSITMTEPEHSTVLSCVIHSLSRTVRRRRHVERGREVKIAISQRIFLPPSRNKNGPVNVKSGPSARLDLDQRLTE